MADNTIKADRLPPILDEKDFDFNLILKEKKTVDTIFCIGNGESRKEFNLDKLRPHGKIYGCNALYRDFKPDVLVSVDPGISHEIYHSGYCKTNQTWFRDWNKFPEHQFNQLVKANITDEELQEISKNSDSFIMNQKTESTKFFTFHGFNFKNILQIYKDNYGKYNDNIKKEHKLAYISWINDDDKVNSLSEMPIKDRGWSAGATAGLLACNQNHFTIKKFFMLGFDFYSTNDKVNNVYKNTKNYVDSNTEETNCINWFSQWGNLIKGYPRVTFYKVNKSLNQDNKIDKKFEEFKHLENLIYITYEEFKNILDKK